MKRKNFFGVVLIMITIAIVGWQIYSSEFTISSSDMEYLRATGGTIIDSDSIDVGYPLKFTSAQIFFRNGRVYVTGDAKRYDSEDEARYESKDNVLPNVTYHTEIVKEFGQYKNRGITIRSSSEYTQPQVSSDMAIDDKAIRFYGKVHDRAIKKIELYDREDILSETYYIGESLFYLFEVETDYVLGWGIRCYDVNNNLIFMREMR